MTAVDPRLHMHSSCTQPGLLPNLEHLTIRGEWGECDEMMEAIESRVSVVGDTTAGRRLKRDILPSHLVHGSVLERLDKCVKEGMIYENR